MIRARRLALTAFFCALSASAQTAPTEDQILQADPLLVQEPRIAADAAGTTRVRLDDPAVPLTHSLGNLSGRVANLHISTGGAGSYGDLFAIRGLTNTPYFSDPAVTLYFDDLPLGSAFTYPTNLFGFGTATIHRGPQATAFGRGGSGGVLVFSSAEPTASSRGELRASVGNIDSRSAALNVRSARRETLDASVAASFAEREGFITNTQLNQRVDDLESAAASARFRYRPTATSEIALQLLGSRLRNGAQPLVPLGGPLYSVERTAEGETHIDFGGVALKARFDTGLGQLTATTSYTDFELNPYTNQLVLPPSLDSSITLEQSVWSEEIRLASPSGAARPWHVGLWFSDSETAGDVNRALTGLFPIEISAYRLDTRTAALFGQIGVIEGHDWSVTLGLRAERVKRAFDRRETVPAPGRYAAERTFDALLPKLSLRLALTPSTTASASVSLASKPGGWSAFTANPSLARFDAERTLAFDAGIDTDLANKTVNLAVRAFAYSIREYQIERAFTFTDYLVVNAPRVRSVGAEFEATWRPLAGLTFAASLGVTHITLREFTDPFTGTNYSGNRAPYVPSYDANLSASYRHASGWFAGAEATFAGETFYDESEAAAFAQDARATLNARLGYDAARWRISVFGENLFEEDYYTLIIPGVGHGVPAAPRTYGIEAVVKW
ncbi:MAG TPA: TonB-dependent receptor [Opitutus sp.]|nr:TonB-dependent receptor [Opitutus sp.]